MVCMSECGNLACVAVDMATALPPSGVVLFDPLDI